MKIISGKYRGKPLKTPQGMDTRPTTSRVKESVFNIIQFDIPDATVLDLFAGSGQMGIECLSRGAEFCDFIDMDKKAISVIKENLKDVDKNYKIHNTDYNSYIKSCNKQYDIILLDPPYHKNFINFSLKLIKDFKLLKECGIIMSESYVDDIIDLKDTNFFVEKTYKYGTINISRIKGI